MVGLTEGNVDNGGSERIARKSFHYSNLSPFRKYFRYLIRTHMIWHKFKGGKQEVNSEHRQAQGSKHIPRCHQRVGPKVGFKLSSSQQERGNLAVTQFTMSRR